MRTLTLHFPDDALSTLDTFLKQTKEARVFRRAQAVRDVVQGHRLHHAPLYLLRPAPVGPSLCSPGGPGSRRLSPLWSPAHSDLRASALPRSPRRPRSAPARLEPCSVALSGTCHRARPPDRGPAPSRERPRRVKKNDVSSSRPTGRLAPAPAALAWASLALAALEYRARRGEMIVLYDDETIVWRFALPRAGWWRTAQRSRLPTRPLSHSQITAEASHQRQAWVRSRSGNRVLSQQELW